MKLHLGILAGLLVLGACTVQPGGSNLSDGDFMKNVPEAVVALAAPHQNLEMVRLMPEDGCFWYRHNGPVETTMLPLRTVEGRPICTQSKSEPAPVG